MAKPKKQQQRTADQRPLDIEPVPRPLLVAKGLGGIVLLLGLIMVLLGAGVAAGRITDGWGFPMSAVSNWGQIWGLVLIVAGAAQVIAPALLIARPQSGSIVMMIVSGLCVLVGTPVITTTTEILYNLSQEMKSRPDWVDAIWGYYMILHIALIIALFRAFPVPTDAAPAEKSA